MLNCKIKVKNFKKLLDSLKRICTPETETCMRDCLKYIQLTIKQDSIVAVGCNGYQLSKYTLYTENESEFVCYFKPFYFRCFQWMEDKEVSIEFNEETKEVSIKIPASFGRISYEFENKNITYPDLSDALENAKEKRKEGSIKFNPALLEVTSKSFLNGKHSYVELSMPQDDLAPMYCKAKLGEGELLEHIILPVKRNDV